jgi:hypothetical protein
MPHIPGLRVVRSTIDGYGVVADRPFAAGELIAEVDGYVWFDGEDVDDNYSLWLDEGVYWDMLDQTRWINHSCEPNASIEAEARPKPWARIVATRDIAVGEEIAYDYAFVAELAEPCRCGTKSCRGYIVDEDELPRLRELIAGRIAE